MCVLVYSQTLTTTTTDYRLHADYNNDVGGGVEKYNLGGGGAVEDYNLDVSGYVEDDNLGVGGDVGKFANVNIEFLKVFLILNQSYYRFLGLQLVLNHH